MKSLNEVMPKKYKILLDENIQFQTNDSYVALKTMSSLPFISGKEYVLTENNIVVRVRTMNDNKIVESKIDPVC